MNDDICDIFDDADILDTDAIVYEMVSGESGGGMGLDYAQTDTPAGRISTLSELFLEWYLFDSSEEKDVKKFLAEAEIQDVLNEAQFMDLMCGMAYLDDDLLQFISLKLPFSITTDKLHRMNAKVATSKKAYKIESKSNVADKIKDQAQQNERARKDRKNARKRELYAQNPEKYREQGRIWRAKNPEKVRAKKRRDWAKHATEYNAKKREKRKENREALLAKARQWYADHREERRAYEKMRRERDRESRKAVQRSSVEKNKAHYARYKKGWYESHKDHLLQQNRERYQKNKVQIQQDNKARYEKNKEQYLAQRKLYRAELKQKTESAQKICAAYVFLMNLRKTNREKYLELYTRQQEPLTSMLKTCVALQKMDINLCPFCNSNSEQTVETCCNPNVLSLPDVNEEIKAIVAKLKKAKWRQDNKEHFQQYEKMRRERDRESRKAVQKRSVEKNKAHYARYKKRWYESHKDHLLQQNRERYQKNKVQIQQDNKDRYEKNKEQYLAQRKLYRAKLKQKAEAAQKICAAYVFLLNLKKTNKAKYSELYPGQRNPLVGMLKMCPALQKMDINLCPFCNPDSERTVETCCNPNVLSLPDAISELQIISANLMKNRAQNGK